MYRDYLGVIGMRKFNIINYLKDKCNLNNKSILNDFLIHLENILMNVDEFEGTLYFDIYEFIYVFEDDFNQDEISDELGISQSKVCKTLKKIDEFIYKLLRKKEYTELQKIISKEYKHEVS